MQHRLCCRQLDHAVVLERWKIAVPYWGMLPARKPSRADPRSGVDRAARPWYACAIATIALALVAGCAPDAIRKDSTFNAWIDDVRTVCYRALIGPITVGNLLSSTGSREGGYFFNQTSRLYAGQLTAQQWTSGVTAFISGKPSDPGVQCVLNQLAKK